MEAADSGIAIVLESRGGGGRNPDYNERLRQILGRLASISARISDATVESTRAQGLALAQGRLQMAAFPYPIRLRPMQDVESLRFAIGRAQVSIAQSPGARGGNPTKKIRIAVDLPSGYTGRSLGEWKAFLSGAAPVGSQEAAARDEAPDDLPAVPSLQVITDADEITAAQEQFTTLMRKGADALGLRSIGHRGGHVDAAVFHRRDLDLWMGFAREPNRFWNAFGFDRPGDTGIGSIVTEINPPLEGINRQTAGAFAADAEGQLYLVHNGKIGGGRPGIGKSAFLSYYRRNAGPLEQVVVGDAIDEMIVIASLADARLPAHVATFVRVVQDFKASITADPSPPSPALPKAGTPAFSPEFAGRKEYATRGRIVADCIHGTIANTLARTLKERGYDTVNDQRRDVMILGVDGGPRVLFEVKPSSDSYSVYTAIGQLFFHTALHPEIRRVAVLPHDSGGEVRTRLKALGIGFIGFEWQGQRLRFHGLEEAAGVL